MHHLYPLVTGPLLYAAVTVFIGGILLQTGLLVMETYRRERFVFSFLSLKSALLSMFHWAAPFGSTVMRKNVTLTLAGFLFHIFLFIVPVFFLSHVLLVYEAWEVSWPTLPAWLADAGTLTVSASCLFFLARRLVLPELRYISTPMDLFTPVLVFIPFATGFWAAHNLPGFRVCHMVHIVSAEILLASIPFTRLTHMVFGFFTRIYTSSEFGRTRFAKDW